MRLEMLIRSPFILYRQTAAYWLKSSLLPSRLIIHQRTLTNSTKLLKMPPTQLQQQNGLTEMPSLPLLLETQTGDDTGILLAKMNVPRTKNALSRALVNQACFEVYFCKALVL
uniref:Enoyl-CoA hydratase n=1 Tax=Meloidogyne hapla TaxID=6305 RepID=A0A1I8B032_MELHA